MGNNNNTQDVYRPCPCGSGQKFKFCCRDRQPTDAELLEARANELIAEGRGREAAQLLDRAIRLDPRPTSPYNNLALALYLQGDLERAAQVTRQVLRESDPRNAFALGNLIHFLILQGRREEAEQTGDLLAPLPPRDEWARQKKAEALARLRRHHAVLETGVPYFAGVAALNLGQDGRRLLQTAALRDPAFREMARRHLACLDQRRAPATLDGGWPYFRWFHWISQGLFVRFRTEEEARKVPGLVEVIACLLEDDPDDETAQGLLEQLKTPESTALLRRIAGGTFGSDDLRLRAVTELQRREPGGTFRVWLRGEWHEIEPRLFELTDEIDSDLPEALRDRMAEMLQALRDRNWARAEALGRELEKAAPRCTQVLQNLATALGRQGKEAEGEALLERALQANPDYMFAAASLAGLRLQQGRVDEARAILRRVTLADTMHPSGYALFLIAETEVSMAEKDFEAAAQSWEMAKKIAPGHPAVAELEGRIGIRLMERLADSRERQRASRERQRQRILTRDAGLAECLADLTVEELKAMARALGTGTSGRKAELLERVATAARAAPVEPDDTLRAVWAAGDVLSHLSFTRDYGPEALDRLRLLGLLAEGAVAGRPSVLIPAERRAAVAAAMAAAPAR